MKISNKLALAVLAFAAILTLSPFLTLQTATAHTPPWTIVTYAYLAVSPNPVGVGESVFLVMWVHPNPPTAAGIGGDRWKDMTVTVTKPDGTTQTLGPFISDATGSTFTSYTPEMVGTYKFVLNYPGQTISMKHPQTGIKADVAALARFGMQDFENDTALPSSATEFLTVQQNPVPKIADYPLPSSYWTRPIEGQNTAWASIASNWLSGVHLGGMKIWQRDGVAPQTSHILWTKPIEFGGIVGGSDTYIPSVAFYHGGSYEGRLANAIIMHGRLYFALPLGHAASGGGYMCWDLKTGEQLWYSDKIGVIGSAAPSKAQLFDYESMNQHGVVGGILWQVIGTTWVGYDGFTGRWVYNLTNVPNGFEVYTNKGEIVRYVLNYNSTTRSGWLALWNNTQDNMGLGGAIGTTSEAYQWRPNGKSVNMSNAYSWNISISYDLTGKGTPTIAYVIPGDIIFGHSTPWAGFTTTGTPNPYTLWAISDKPETRGQLLWKKDYPAPPGNITRNFGPQNEIERVLGYSLGQQCVDPVNRVILMTDEETFQWLGYSLDTGELLWGPVGGDFNAYQYYGSGLGGGQIGFPAYGNLYTQGYGGEIHCYSTRDGRLLWKYNNTNSGMETPWGNYPIFIAAIADGKVYAFNNEHSPNTPLYKGEKIYCIDAYTGQELWTMLGWAGQSGGPGTSTSLLADGVLVYYNYYDNQLYAVGKGPSAITVDAPSIAVPECQPLTIRGTVTDISAGAKKLVADGKFNIVPAVADESMSAFMEFLYMQKPCPANAKGVPVKLTAIDANGNAINIGTTTSDASGLYAMTWTPPSAGMYKIVATFEGSGSYWPSSAETAISVSPAQATPTPTPTPEATVSATTGMVIVAVVILALIIGLVNLLLLLKKKQ
ncbi:MAG: PQQ-binding-like beta-propeller repeat protein [Candidatus Bathyarchaeota archaeon]|nr:PQQ-binding-like beta-propeller repeat protein [Candidatus Bathyarchaeota archaeon]